MHIYEISQTIYERSMMIKEDKFYICEKYSDSNKRAFLNTTVPKRIKSLTQTERTYFLFYAHIRYTAFDYTESFYCTITDVACSSNIRTIVKDKNINHVANKAIMYEGI